MVKGQRALERLHLGGALCLEAGDLDLQRRHQRRQVMLAGARRPGKLEAPEWSFLWITITPVPSHVSTFIDCLCLPTKTNSARDRGSARIHSRTSAPGRSLPRRMSTGSRAT